LRAASNSSGAAQRAKLDGKDIRPRQAKTQTANAEEGVRLTVLGKSGHRFVAAGVESPDRHRPLAGPAQHGVVSQVLRLLIRQPGFLPEQKLGSHEADAVGILRVRMLEILHTLNVDQEPYFLSAP
jgi:hypothetical protein